MFWAKPTPGVTCSAWKGILRRFFREFLELFFPAIAEGLDFESLEFPDKELFKRFPDGVEQRPDVVARLRTKGTPGS